MYQKLRNFNIFAGLPELASDLLKSFFANDISAVLSGIFVSAFLWSKLQGTLPIIIYFSASFVATALFFFVNSYLIKRFNVPIIRNFSLGLVLMALAPLILVSITEFNLLTMAVLGFVFGAGAGLLWSNRNYLSIDATTNANRNQFYGIQSGLGAVAGALVPIVAGYVISASAAAFGVKEAGYIGLMVVGLLLNLFAVYLLRDNKYHQPKLEKLMLGKVTAAWWQTRLQAMLFSARYGLMLFIPGILVLTLLGSESTLGVLETASSLMAAVISLYLGRTLGVEKRSVLMWLSLIFIGIAVLPVAIFYSGAFVVVLFIFKNLATPISFNLVAAKWYHTLDKEVARDPSYSKFAYLTDLEIFINLGRLVAMGVFVVLSSVLSLELTVRISLVLIAVTQAAVWLVPLGKSRLRSVSATETNH